jgi:hypothetical protein
VLWLSFRQFRGQAAVVAAALVALAVLLVIVGLQALDDYHATVTSCVTSGGCSGAAAEFVHRYQQMGQWLSGLVLVVPGLVGIFWGAPLLARELESGTFRLAWTQGVSRARWTLCKLGLLGLASMAVAGLCSLLVTWWSSPLDLAVGAGPFANFDTRGIVPIGYAAFAFSLGVGMGAVMRRTVAAMGATLVAFVGVRLAFMQWVRPHLMAPVVTRLPFRVNSLQRIQIGSHLPQGAWVVSQSVVNAAGQHISGGPGGLLDIPVTNVGPGGISIPGVGTCANIRPTTAQLAQPQTMTGLITRCFNQLHLTTVTTYQPANRYWPLQTYEALIFLAAAAAVGAFTVWWVRRIN